MKELTDEITEYINHLKNEYLLNVSVHIGEKYLENFPYFEKISPFNFHLNPYCMSIKKDNFQKCIECQKKVLKKCQKYSSFIGECHAGVLEYVHAVTVSGKPIGFISVSGYRGKKYPKEKNSLYTLSLTDTPIPENTLKTVIPPLARMLELSFICGIEETSDSFRKITAFISEYHTDITLDTLCKKFHFSKSYISHIFKAKTGLTLKSYCNRLKINDAKELLKNTELSVTDIAYTTGFGNLSYFISTFKSEVGCTPLAYRKRKQ